MASNLDRSKDSARRLARRYTTGGPGFSFEHFKQLDFLRDDEAVLIFDDGPWLVKTPSVSSNGSREGGGGLRRWCRPAK